MRRRMMPNARTKVDLDPTLFRHAAAVSGAVVLDEVSLLGCSTRYDRIEGREPLELSIAVTPGATLDETQGSLSAVVVLTLEGKKKASQGPKESLVIQGTFGLVYSVREEASFSDEQVDAFAKTNAIYNIWPYWREFVQSMSARMNLPPLIIPVFHLFGKPAPFVLYEPLKKKTRSTSRSAKRATRKKAKTSGSR